METLQQEELREIELKIPDVGDTSSIELVKWHLQEGENFSQGDELCDLVTDKAAFSLEAPQDGRLLQIFEFAQKSVSVGQAVARVQVLA